MCVYRAHEKGPKTECSNVRYPFESVGRTDGEGVITATTHVHVMRQSGWFSQAPAGDIDQRGTTATAAAAGAR